MQIGAVGTARRTQACDDGKVLDQPIRTQQGAEIVPRRKVDHGIDVVDTAVARRHSRLTVQQRQAGAAGAVQVGVDVDVFLRVQCQLVGAPAHCLIDVDIAGSRAAASRAGGALNDHGIVDQAGRQRRASHVAAGGGNGVVGRIDQPGTGCTVAGRGADVGAVGNLDAGGGSFNKTAIAATCAPLRRRVQRAADIDGAGRHAAEQRNAAAVIVHRARFDRAGVVDHARHQRILGAGRHDDDAAVGLNHAAVLDQRGEHALIDFHVDQIVAAKRQRRRAARAQCHAAEPGRDDALVADVLAQQCDITGRVDRALVDDTGAAVAAEAARAAIQAGVIDLQRGGDQAADIDVRAGAKQDAVRVDQIDLTIGVEVTENLRAIDVGDAVDRDRARIRLDEIDRFWRGNIKTFPV